MARSGVGERAAETLLHRKEELAIAVTQTLYSERPELLQRYGEAGRLKCLQDMRYNLEHLAPAVALMEPQLFARYVAWLRDMLGARGVAADEILRSLELTELAVRKWMNEDEAAAIISVLREGLAAVAHTSQ